MYPLRSDVRRMFDKIVLSSLSSTFTLFSSTTAIEKLPTTGWLFWFLAAIPIFTFSREAYDAFDGISESFKRSSFWIKAMRSFSGCPVAENKVNCAIPEGKRLLGILATNTGASNLFLAEKMTFPSDCATTIMSVP